MRQKSTKEQVNHELKNLGRHDIEMIGEYTYAREKTDFKCNKGHLWSAGPHSVLSGSGCPECGRLSKFSSSEKVNEQLKALGKGIVMIGEYTKSKSKTEFRCVNGHEWLAKPSSIISGTGCPHCSGKAPLTKEIVNERLENLGSNITLTGPYLGSLKKTEFQCGLGHTWPSRPANVLNAKSGCPICSVHGFNPVIPAYIYVLVFESFIKYGITNDIDRRLLEHKRNGKYQVALKKLYSDGQMALDWENKIKKTFGGKYAKIEECPDGWTETLPLDHLVFLSESWENL